MLVDNPLYQQPYFSLDYSTELNDIFDTELFNSTFAMGGSALSASPSGSRGSSPQTLMTPPQDAMPTSFPELFSLFDDDFKTMDPLAMPSTSTDFMNLATFDGSFGGSVGGYGMDMSSFPMGMDLSSMNVNPGLVEDPMQTRGIDPQLVDTPSAVSDHGEDESDTKEESPVSPSEEDKSESDKPTITIAPVKVGGHGKARKGTVQSGGVVKKTATSSANKDKENTSFAATSSKKLSQPKAPGPAISTSLFTTSTPGPFLTSAASSKAESEAGDDDDDLPHDWRPSPEVFAKMTSKEKRQLRNKISARNFRVRRKEYISTLEGDIAERDRMLDHFRTQLGSQESENLALRQEIAALKKALLDGRGGSVNLPHRRPCPNRALLKPRRHRLFLHTQSTDVAAYGQSLLGWRWRGGGFTPVHTTLVPDISTVVRKGLQENMNPALNAHALPGFDGFADLNPFTMKTLDAYRMHLWGKMAAQQQQNGAHQQQPAATAARGGLAAARLAASALLSGKHTPVASALAAGAYPSPPASPLLTPKATAREQQQQQQREKEQQHALLAAMASQTVFRKLGSAFWEAFSGASPSPRSSLHGASSHAAGNWDQDKVQRVLEGKAVLRVVDVEPATPPATPKLRAAVASTSKLSASALSQDDARKCGLGCVADILEESMRSLSLGKK
ncbi:hypothetical protein BJ912DRAFT_964248 [Pholiota molesta]|nr:hypothetical protein BJ912DRAFT_964248 [Pholiota molesta]